MPETHEPTGSTLVPVRQATEIAARLLHATRCLHQGQIGDEIDPFTNHFILSLSHPTGLGKASNICSKGLRSVLA